MKFNTIRLGLVLILLQSVVWLGACVREPEAGAETKAKLGDVGMVVSVGKVERRTMVQKVELTGNVKAWREIDVVPDVPGKVAKIYVDVGDRVRKGQKLAALDTTTFRLQVAQAEAGVAVAEANLHTAERDWERAKKLYAAHSISQQMYEKAKLGYEAAKAQLAQAQSGLATARHMLDVAIMRAPFDGIVTGRYIDEGEYINPAMGGMTMTKNAVVSVMDISKVKVEAEAAETDIPLIKIGQQTIVKVDAYPNREFQGAIERINPAADPMSRLFEITIKVPNPDELLRPGMFARVWIIVRSVEDAVAVPEKAVVKKPDGRTVVFLVENNRAKEVKVKIGFASDGYIQILSGLNGGETIVVEGAYGLKDGLKLIVSNQ